MAARLSPRAPAGLARPGRLTSRGVRLAGHPRQRPDPTGTAYPSERPVALHGRHGQPSTALPLFHWFRRNLWLVNPEEERAQREAFTTRELSGSRARRIAELLRVADLGITGAEIVADGGGATTVQLLHRSSAGDVAFDWRNESFGTRSWFALLGPLLLALDEGAVLLVDELDASLHPRFAAEVVRLFHDPLANPKGAQLVFTSHDPSVLTTPSGGRLLEPGQVWLTEKDKDGASELYPLTAAEPGADEDLMRSYLAGAFGAVPELLEGQIARRLLAATGQPGGHDAEGS